MDELIRQLIDIEEKAQSFMSEAKEKAKNVEEQAQKETKGLAKEIHMKAERKCETLKSLEDTQADNRIKQITEKTSKQMRILEEKYQQNKAIWVESVFQEVINF